MIKRFLDYVEIKTKITSLFAFLMTIAYLFSAGAAIDPLKTLIFFFSMFLFDLTTTAINNYVDTKSNDQVLQFKRKTALLIIFILFIVSTGLGLLLAALTDVVVLLLGALCFLFGVCYTYGPLPINRQPWGEFFSGLFYGFLIPFILLYINMPQGTYLMYDYSSGALLLVLKLFSLLTVFLLGVAPFAVTANIMLANNICDLEKDILVRRYTLPYYIGKQKALYLFAGLYYSTYLSVILMVVLRILSPVCLLTLVTFPLVQKNIMILFRQQDKAVTFIGSIKNYILIMAVNTLLILIGGFLR